MFPRRLILACCSLVLAGSLLPGVGSVTRAADAVGKPPFALLVGGGPDVENNAAQIEGHVRFVASLLPPAAKRAVLFADGKTDQPIVSYADTGTSADARRALAFLLADQDAGPALLTRAPKLNVPLDGAARLRDFRRALSGLSVQAAKGSAPLLLYFAGHGTQDEKNEADTYYNLWKDEPLKVRDLTQELSRLPRQLPVVLVMAQCFSGAFADVIFRGGDIKEGAVQDNIAGFFSARKDREAAGCSYATERADYQDFSSYFFAALGGEDRFGGKVSGADFDGNGAVSLHEAFCYALIHDQSTDTPVCTSDVFLQSRAALPEAEIYGAPFGEVMRWGTPAQRAVLSALSEQLGLSGEGRAIAVYDRLVYGDPAASPALLKAKNETKEQGNALRQRSLGALFERWPDLRWGAAASAGYEKALEGAADELDKDEGRRRALLEAANATEQASEAVDNEEAALQRFASVYAHIVEAHSLGADGKGKVKAQYEKLWQAEQSVLTLSAPR